MKNNDSERLYHIERKLDKILSILENSPIICPSPAFPNTPWPFTDPYPQYPNQPWQQPPILYCTVEDTKIPVTIVAEAEPIITH